MEPETTNKSSMPMIIGIIVVLAVIAYGVYAYTQKKDGDAMMYGDDSAMMDDNGDVMKQQEASASDAMMTEEGDAMMKDEGDAMMQ